MSCSPASTGGRGERGGRRPPRRARDPGPPHAAGPRQRRRNAVGRDPQLPAPDRSRLPRSGPRDLRRRWSRESVHGRARRLAEPSARSRRLYVLVPHAKAVRLGGGDAVLGGSESRGRRRLRRRRPRDGAAASGRRADPRLEFHSGTAGPAVSRRSARPAHLRARRARHARRARTPGMGRMDARAILRNAEQRMTSVDPTTVLGAAPDALVEPVPITDAQGGLTFANATAARVLGAARDVGRPVSDLLDRLPARTPDGAALAPALHPIRRALAQAQAVIGAELTIDLEGCPATFLVNTVPLRDAEGRLTGSVSVFHDVTGARQLERDAAEHAARLRTLVDLVNEGIFIIAADGALVFTNGVGRSLLGAMPPGERPADRIDRLRMRAADGAPLPPERLPSYRALHGEPVPSMELLIAAANGTTRRAEGSAHPLRRDGVI